MGELPMLLRRARVMKVLGVTSKQVSKFVAAGKLSVVKCGAGSWAHYKRDEVLKLAEEMHGQ